MFTLTKGLLKYGLEVNHLRLRNICIPRAMSSGGIKFVWVDLELTGLELEKDKIMELACVITDPDLNKLHKGYHSYVHVDEQSLSQMNDWCVEHHGKSGLTEAVRNCRKSCSQVEKELKDYVNGFTNKNDTLHMAGNSVYMDRIFINRDMPAFSKMLHYRLLDVSSIKLLASQWYPECYEKAIKRKRLKHLALKDVEDSIEELRQYRSLIFKEIIK